MNDQDRALGGRAGGADRGPPADVPPAPGLPPPGTDGLPGSPGAEGAPDVDELAALVYERLTDKIGHRAEPPGELPSVADAVALRERAPELYDLWLRIAQERAETGNYVQRAPYEVPERLAQSGRPRAFSSLVVVLAFCGYLAWLGGPGPYIAGLIALLDLVVMLGLFFGLRPEHLSEARRPARKRLPAARRAGRCAADGRPGTSPGRPPDAAGQATRRRCSVFSMVTA